jgi:hypothetical protein
MKKIVIILCAVVLLFSCARKYSISNIFRKGIPPGIQQWVLDSSYHLYVREVFLDTSDAGDKAVQSSIRSNNSNNKLIELEYLLLSEKQNKALYIATIPDKYQLYYAKKMKYLQREYMNAYDFSTFRFGKKTVNHNEIVFKDSLDKLSHTWKYEIESDSILHVYQVEERINGDASNVYLVDEALSRKASFIKLDSFRIAFRNMDKEKNVETKKGRPPLKRFSDNVIYFNQQGSRYTIYFRFNRNLPPAYKDSAISFGNNRLVNMPF